MTNKVETSQLREISVHPIPGSRLIELGVIGRKHTIAVELTERQSIELAAALRAAVAAVRVDGP